MSKSFGAVAHAISNASGRPWAFGLAGALILLWIVTGPVFGFSDTWQLVINTVTSIVTFLMVFLIQNAQNRDTQALHLKLDELIRVTEGAQNKLIALEGQGEEELALVRQELSEARQDDRATPLPATSRSRTG